MTLSNKMIDILIKKIIRIETRKYVKRDNHYDYIYDFQSMFTVQSVMAQVFIKEGPNEAMLL